LVKLEDLYRNPEICALIEGANSALAAMGYTEHGRRHVGYVSQTAARLLRELHYPQRMVELAAMAGWVHDVGNAVNRSQHGAIGATLLFPILRDLGMDSTEIVMILGAVGAHEESNGTPIHPLSAAIILADKSDAHRTRVRKGHFNPKDIHDRVNYAISMNEIKADAENKVIRMSFAMDPTSSVLDFMEIYLSRMKMCQASARLLGCRFELVINGQVVNTQQEIDK